MVDAKVEYVAPFFFAKQAALDSNAQPITHFDGEKVVAEDDRVTVISRDIPAGEASGEYIGVARFSAEGARSLREHYHRMKAEYAGRIWRDGVPFAKAYLIHLFQEMLIEGLAFHMATTDGEYMEIDTEEDFALANARWSQEDGG